MKLSDQEIVFRMALQEVEGIGAARAKKLITEYGSAGAVFSNNSSNSSVDGIGLVHWKAIKNFRNFKKAEQEFSFIKKNRIQFLAFDQENYPSKLKRAIDSPSFMYYQGDESIHNTRVLSFIGTRACSDYGRQMCEKLIEDLAPHQPLIVSGLAYGIDSIAHKAAIKNGLKTIGVMATGLDSIYPAQNKKLAESMKSNGGLLTEYPQKSKPDREHFPTRNRIVAGMADAVIVVETAKKGGSMITANLAFSYNRDVFCVPGRIGDKRSEGCNNLIKNLRANLITSAEDVVYYLNWDQDGEAPLAQRKLFVELSDNEKLIYDSLQSGNLHVDELFQRTKLSMSKLSPLLLQLEMNGMVRSLPGKLYQAV